MKNGKLEFRDKVRILKKFTNPADPREFMQYVQGKEGFAYATNGHILIKMPMPKFVGDEEGIYLPANDKLYKIDPKRTIEFPNCNKLINAEMPLIGQISSAPKKHDFYGNEFVYCVFNLCKKSFGYQYLSIIHSVSSYWDVYGFEGKDKEFRFVFDEATVIIMPIKMD